MTEIQEVQQVRPVIGKTVIGMAGLNAPTPMWVTWIFRTEFVLNKAALVYIASSDLVRTYNVKEIVLILTIVDFITWGIGRFIGVRKGDFET